MRPRAALPLLLALALLPVPATAQGGTGTNVLEDPAGDAGLMVEDQFVPDSTAWGALDQTSLSVLESKDTLTLVLGVKDITSGGRSDVLFQSHSIRFLADDTRYMVQMFHADEVFSWLYRDAGEAGWFSIERLYPVIDTAAHTYTVDIPREELLNSQGSSPQPGWLLSEVWAESRSFQISGCCTILDNDVPAPTVRYGDRMPDAGQAPLPYEIQLGLAQKGHAFLLSPAPTRSSNGEASTFVFDVTAFNLGDADDRFVVRTQGAPSHWTVIVPDSVVEIPGGANISIPVLVTIPFAHKHGSFESLVVEMASLSDPGSVGRVELGIRYTEIPQPTGHHDTVWFHSSFSEPNEFETAFGAMFAYDGTEGYMNAAEQDGVDAGRPVPAWRIYRTDAGEHQYLWRLWLSPALDMGIDWDLARTGTMQVPIQTTVPLIGAQVTADLVYRRPADDRAPEDPPAVVRLATAASEAVDIDGAHVFELSVQGLPEADFIAWQKDASLHLDIRLTATGAGAPLGPADTVPRLNGGSMQLPLNEYRDPVDDVYSTVSGLVIHAGSPQERLANPGSSVLFFLDLMDHNNAHGTFDIKVTGANSDWAQVVGDATIQIAKGGTRQVVIGVRVPDDARDGDVADLVVQVTHRSDPSIQSLARILVEVDKGAEHPDETDKMLEMQGLLTSKKDTPMLPVVAPLAVLGLLALRRRR